MSHLQEADYGLIGNSSSAALVSRLGAIDWCCLPYLDSPSLFAAILDETQGGRFQLMPLGDFRSSQRYHQRTLVLETHFETPHGSARLTDWMPADSGEESPERPMIRRRIEVVDGKIEWQLQCSPRFGYGAYAAQAERSRGGILFRGPAAPDSAYLLAADGAGAPLPLEIAPGGGSVTARFTLASGQRADFCLNWGRRPFVGSALAGPRLTQERWHSVAHRCPSEGCAFSGPWHDAVSRSALVLRVLCNPRLGSIAESVTTSVPGVVPGSRNWDYRYAWIRETAPAMQALAALGTPEDARALFEWLADLLIRDGAESLQPVYRIDGGRFLPEKELPALRGFQGSHPVRVGNLSSSLFSLDLYGHVMLAAWEYLRLFGGKDKRLPAGVWDKLAGLADFVCQAWRRPDHGTWESRSKPEHYVASKAYCWVAIDRACALARELGQEIPRRWESEREVLHRTVCEQGYDHGRRSFVGSFGDREVDASALLLPMLGFLPFTDPRIQSTLLTVQTELADGVLLHRYRGADGIPGQDAPHLATSFLFASCLALSGRVDEASDRLAELCTYATPLGFLGDQVNVSTGEPTGNFPCASSHLALINTALYVSHARGRLTPSLPLLAA